MSARFKLDENLPRDLAVDLQRAGHDVETVLDEQLGGEPDAEVFETCQREKRVLVTLDLDFADIRQYPPDQHAGVWVLRPPSQSVTNIVALLPGALKLLEAEEPHGHLWIIERERVRIR